MAVRIRLRRTGAKKKPHYRVVVADSRAQRDGRFIEILGHYNPLPDPPVISLKHDRVEDWLDKGAQPTETVARLLETSGITVRRGGSTFDVDALPSFEEDDASPDAENSG